LLKKRSKRKARIVFIVLLIVVLLSPLEVKGKIAWAVLITTCGVYTMLLRRARSGGIGSGAAGAFYEMLHQDKRRAIEIIVEKKAEEQAPEDAEGDGPDMR